MEDPPDLAQFALPSFDVVRMREGYAVDEVRQFAAELLRRIIDEPEAATPVWVQGARFTPVRRGGAYDMGQVDAWLDDVSSKLPAQLDPQTSRTGIVPSGVPAPSAGAARVLEPDDFVPPPFELVRLREGYSIKEVDEFVSELRRRVTSEPAAATPQWVLAARFSPVRLRTCYAMGPVDDWLDQVAAALGG